MLICSTLSGLPIYFISLFTIQINVRLRLEKIQRYFLRGGGALENNLHLVKWSTILRPR